MLISARHSPVGSDGYAVPEDRDDDVTMLAVRWNA
jgi:hypothetical protein